jgi:outer membrane lipoprotein SlyB
MKNIIKAIVVSMLSVVAIVEAGASYADDMTGSYYNRGEQRRIQSTRLGRVEGVRAVTLNTEASITGKATGAAVAAALGGLLAGRVGNPYAQFAVASLAGVGGGFIGGKVSQESVDALEIVVTLDQGGSVVVVQEVDPRYPVQSGDRVRLIEGREVRVATIR